MARKSWGDLSPAYRQRLERSGISQTAYESGASLSAARGHDRTPEHPIEAGDPVPKQYERWYNARHNRPIKMLTTDGEQWLTDTSTRSRSLIGSHWNAVKAYLFDIRMPGAFWWNGRTTTALRSFRNLTVKGAPIRAGGTTGPPATFRFMTDADDVAEWTQSDVLEFTEIYKTVA